MRPDDSIQTHWGKYLGVGMGWVASTALFTLAGRWLDGRFETRPVFTLIGVFVGAVGGFYHMYRELAAAPPERQTRPVEEPEEE